MARSGLNVEVIDRDSQVALADLLAAEPWTEVRPGVFRRSVWYKGTLYRQSRKECQDCKTPWPDTLMLVLPLWKQLYPGNGVACRACIEHRLGRLLQEKDLMEARCNTLLRETLHQRGVGQVPVVAPSHVPARTPVLPGHGVRAGSEG